MDRAKFQPPQDPPSATRADVGRFLSVSPTHVSDLVRREGLPAVNIGTGRRARLRFRLSEVAAWLETRRERQIEATLDGRRFTRLGAA
jgi:hypothetical protein